MSKDKGEDELEESASRLGDRFGGASSGGEKGSSDGQTDVRENPDSAESQPEKEGRGEGEEIDEWVPATIYLPESKRTEFRRFLKRLTLDHPEIEDAEKRELHTGVIETAIDHPGDVAEHVEEVRER